MNPNHVKIAKDGRNAYIKWRKANPNERFELDDAEIDNLDLYDVDLSNSLFHNAILKNANLSKCILNGINMSNADLLGANFRQAKLIKTVMNGVKLEDAKLNDADLLQAELKNSFLNGADFSECILNHTNFSGADLSNAILFGADIKGAKFNGANLESADFRSVVNANAMTSFNIMKNTAKCKIDRFTLEALENYGGLTNADMMKMKIIDDAAKLRGRFCGIWKWLHVLALLTFIAPYLFFVIVRLSENHYLGIPESGMTLWKALWRYIQAGHGNWQHDPLEINKWALRAFYIFLGYNFLRIILLLKANALELQQSISHLPSIFSLRLKDQKWSYWWPILNILMFVLGGFYIIAVVINAYYFFQTPIWLSIV